MQDSKLIALFRSLAPGELRWLRDFVASPYFNKNGDAMLLCDYLVKQHRRDFPAAALDRRRVFAKVFPEATYDEARLFHTASHLLKLGEQFLGQRRFEAEASLPLLYQLTACVERHLEQSYQYLRKQVETQLEASDHRDARHYYQQYLLSEIVAEHFTHSHVREPDQSLSTCARELDRFYLTRRAALSCAMRDQMLLLPVSFDNIQWEWLRGALAVLPADQQPAALTVYSALMQLLETTEEEESAELKDYYQLFSQHAALFQAPERRVLFYFAVNCCIRRILQGRRRYVEELLRIYEDGLTNGHLLDQGLLSPWDFKNVTKLGLGLRRYDWVEQFINDYAQRLPADQREDAYYFNLADLYYHRQRYDQAMEHLNRVEFSDIHYHLGAKTMLLKIYFETEAWEAFHSLAATYRLFLRRSKAISSEQKQAYLNFITLSLQLAKRESSSEAEAVRERIQSTPVLNDRSWLLQRLENGKR